MWCGAGLGGLHWGVVVRSRDLPDAVHVPVIEAVGGGDILTEEDKRGVGNGEDLYRGTVVGYELYALSDGTWAEGVDNYCDGEGEQVGVEAETLGAIGLDRCGRGGCGWVGFHCRAVARSREVPNVFEVPVVEAVDGSRIVVGIAEGSEGDSESLCCHRAFAKDKEFGDGAGAEGVDDNGGSEGEEVGVEVEALGRTGLGRRWFGRSGGRSVHGGNVVPFWGCGKGVG